MGIVQNSFKIPNQPLLLILLGLCGYVYVLVVNGALPGIGIPTLGQAVWLAGFAKSLVNADSFSVWATDMGYPSANAISIGLPAALPIAVFIRLGIHASDAYALSFAIWLLIAQIGAYLFLRKLDATHVLAIFGATLWVSLPIVWQHQGYSTISLSLALIPTYIYISYSVIQPKTPKRIHQFLSIVTPAVSLFMDGYGFVFYFSVTCILIAEKTIRNKNIDIYNNIFIFLGFLIGYLLYAGYIGTPAYGRAPLDFFRGWGIDLSFPFIPTKGLFVLPDLIGISLVRPSVKFFGDASVHLTTFAAYLIFPGIFFYFSKWGDRRLKSLFLIVALVGFYMALGPSIKLLSYRPEGVGAVMPAEYAWGPTGSGVISKYIPGFYNLRASYRWMVVAFLGFWTITILTLSYSDVPKWVRWCVLALCYAMAMPNLTKQVTIYKNARQSFYKLEADLLPLEKIFSRKEIVAFVPTGNDFLINYLAPRIGIISYNIGGDKNVSSARKHWPIELLSAKSNMDSNAFVSHIFELLNSKKAGAIAVPHIDLLWAAHSWPYPKKVSDDLRRHISSLKASKFFDLVETEYFTVVRLKKSKFGSNGPSNGDCVPIYCVRALKFLTKPLSNTGTYDNFAMHTQNQQGFLHYGPYQPLGAGKYQLTLFGSAELTKESF